MKKKQTLAFLFFLLLPLPAQAKEFLRKFRWQSERGDHKVRTPSATAVAKASGGSQPGAIGAAGEQLVKEDILVGPARVAGAWSHRVYAADGSLVSRAGAVAESAPADSVAARRMAEREAEYQALAKKLEPALAASPQSFAPRLEIALSEDGSWRPYWRYEYVDSDFTQVRYLHLGESGERLAEGSVQSAALDGHAFVLPIEGGPAREEQISGLSGDGNLRGTRLFVDSVLNLNVWAPDLRFFFAPSDRRFDLSQVYYTLDRAFRWLEAKVGVAPTQPLEARLHVGKGGVSNAAFFHQNTIFLGVGDGITYRELARDPSVVIHEGMHSVIEELAGLPAEGEGGGLNEGFADLLTALILDNPRLGGSSYVPEPYRRTLENPWRAYQDFGPGVYRNGSIVGATFWDFRSFLGNELTARLAIRTLTRLGRGGSFAEFPNAVRGAADGLLSSDQLSRVQAGLDARGWKRP